jgi:hypothetical protein
VCGRGARGTPDELEEGLGRHGPMGCGRSYAYRMSYGVEIGMGMGMGNNDGGSEIEIEVR